MQAEQVADRVRVFGAIQPVEARRREMGLRVTIDLVLEPGHEIVPRFGGELATLRRRHQARANLEDRLFPGLGIGRHGVELAPLEIEPPGLLGRVVAIETDPAHDGRLSLAAIADEAGMRWFVPGATAGAWSDAEVVPATARIIGA